MVALAVLSLALRDRQPVYQGHRLRYWVEKYQDGKLGSQQETEQAMRAIGTNAMPWLLRWLQTQESPFYKGWVAARSKLPDALADHLPEPVSAVELRSLTLEAIATLGPQARTAVPTLAQMLRKSGHDWAWRITPVLGEIGPDGLAVLIDGLNDSDVGFRRIVAESLLSSKLTNKTLIPPLTAALKDQDSWVRVNAARTLLRIDPENQAAVSTLVGVLAEDEDREVKRRAITGLYEVAPRATAAVPLLIAILERESSPEWTFTAQAAMHVLGLMGPAAKDAVPVLSKRLHDRQSLAGPIIAAQTLAKIGPAARSAYPDLQRVVADTNQIFDLRAEGANFRLRVESAKALWRIDHDTNAALPYLIWVLQCKAPWLCFGAPHDPEEIVILGGIGPAAKTAVPCLVGLLRAEDEKIRAAAAEALRKIDPQAVAEALKPASQPAAAR